MAVTERDLDTQIRNAFSSTKRKLNDIGIASIYKYDKDGHYLVISLRSLITAIKNKTPQIAWDFMNIDIVENELIIYCPRGELIEQIASKHRKEGKSTTD